MSAPLWHEEAISRSHDRDAFDCGDVDLNEYLKRHARRNHERGGARTFVAIDNESRAILGFYSLSAASLSYTRAPAIITRGLGRHDVPVYRLARLAVDRSVQGRRLGGQLMLAAGRRCLLAAEQAGAVAMLIDAKNERVAAWYGSYGAIALDDSPLTLMLPLVTMEAALRGAGKL